MLEVKFRNSRDELRTIGKANTREEAFKVIDKFLEEHNFISYYKRTWKPTENETIVDVGSHTEFFHIVAIETKK